MPKGRYRPVGFLSDKVRYVKYSRVITSLVVTSNLDVVMDIQVRSNCSEVASSRQSFRNALFSPIGENSPHSHPYGSALLDPFLIRQVIVRLIPSYRRVPLGDLTYYYTDGILSHVERWVGDRSIDRAREHPYLFIYLFAYPMRNTRSLLTSLARV